MENYSIGPLSGIRVVDLSSHIMGPFSTQMMGDMGADVVMVEPIDGSKSRLMGPHQNSHLSPIGMNLMRNKRSISIDLKNSDGRDILLRLASDCDVLVTNLRDAPLKRLGLTYEDINKINKKIVYCHAVGFSNASGRSEDPAFDDIIQSECGIADASQRINGKPTISPTIMADKICGMMIVNAVVSALFQRCNDKSKSQGQYIKIAMLDVMRSFTMLEHGAGALGVPAISSPGYNRVLSKARGPSKTSDGWINIMPYSQREYDLIFQDAGRYELIGSEKTLGVNVQLEADFLYHELQEILIKKTTDYWLSFCKKNHIAVGRIVSLEEIVEDFPIVNHPHFGDYRHIPFPISFSEQKNQLKRPAPLIGEHSLQILKELNIENNKIKFMIEKGHIRQYQN